MKFQYIFTIVLSLLAIQSYAANGSMKGDGSTAKPFQIEDYEDLKAIGKGAYLYSSDYVLTKDIDASASKNEMCNEDGCNGFISIGKNKDAADSIIFWGNIDGKNHTIKNLTIWLPCEKDVAFISYLGGSVTNLNFDHIHVTGRVSESNFVAGVAAKQMGSIKNVHVTNGFVQGQNYVGGIVGQGTKRYNDKAVLEDVSFQGDIKGSQRVGGIVGETDMDVAHAEADVNIIILDQDVGGIVGYLTGNVYQSRSSGTIVPWEDDVDDVGGIVGYSKGDINECVSTMDLMHYGFYYFGDKVGGIVGNGGFVNASYALGSVEGERYVGGIGGSSGVANSFAMGAVRGDEYVGGLVGSGTAQYSYAANVVQGNSHVGGLVGSASDAVVSSYWNTEISGLDTSAGGTGLTTAKMMKFASFAGWDTLGYDEYVIDGTDTCDYYVHLGYCYSPTGKFIRYWNIDEGKSFPYLVNNPFMKKPPIPVAVPTSAPKWQETPKIASLFDVEGELVGKWLGWARWSDNIDSTENGKTLRRDSLYFGYRIGVVNKGDTVWGTSSYMAVPNKIEISTFAELQKIGNDIAYPLIANYELTKDIDASGLKFEPIGDSVRAFTGSFDGKNHVIKNLTIDEPNRDFTGMFGYMEGATVRNLTLQNTKVVGSWCVGALAGEARLSLIHNVVSFNGDVKGESSVGGLIGVAVGDSINVVGTTGNIKGTTYVGGLIGDASTRLENGFSINVIKGYERVGGVVGFVDSYSPSIYRVYSASMIKASDGRGLAGYSLSSSLDSNTCFFDSTLAKYDRNGRTTAEMLKQGTFQGYDFVNIWTIQEGVSYPYFKGMEPLLPGTLKDDGTVNVLAGAGTATNPYRIYDYDDLKYIGKYEYGLDLYYKLMGNINAMESTKENCNADSTVCKGFEPIGEFSGVLIGNDKIISNLIINRPDEDSVGLFRALAKGAKVSGLVFDSTSYFGESYTLGYGYAEIDVRGKNFVGTLAGVDNGAVIENVVANSKVSGKKYVGGIVGSKTSGSITQGASWKDVTGEDFVGGIAGSLNGAAVSDCYSVATVLGENNVGGLTGYSNNATVKNSFAAGRVNGISKWGGIAGEDSKSAYTSVYFDSTLWLFATTAAGELRNTKQMVSKENYKGWDFEKTWNIVADSTYPYLKWMGENSYLKRNMKKFYPNKNIDSTMLRMAGSGTESNPFLIKTYGDLKSIGYGKYRLSSIYRLVNDIDASASRKDVHTNGQGTGFKPIGKVEHFINAINPCNCEVVSLGGYIEQDSSRLFTGKFHGGGHSINNLFVAYLYPGNESIGFIDSMTNAAVIDSLSFKKYEISGGDNGIRRVGGLVGVNEGVVKHVNMEVVLDNIYEGAGLVYDNKGVIENSSVKGTFKGGTLAGVAAMNDGEIVNVKVNAEWKDSSSFIGGVSLVNKGVIKGVSAAIKVKNGYGPLGGIVALNSVGGRIVDDSAFVDVKEITPTETYYYQFSHDKGNYDYEYFSVEGVGGLVAIDSGTVTNSTAMGVLDAGTGFNVGGLIGMAHGSDLKGLHASVDVVGANNVGGFVGENKVKITDSYATGSVKGKLYAYIGGFVGENTGTVDMSFSTGNVTDGGGFVGHNAGVLRRSYTTGDVFGGFGFAYVNQSKIEDCYSTGDVILTESRTYQVGFIGTNSYDNTVRGYATGAIIVDGNTRICNALPKLGSAPSDEFYYASDNCIDSTVIGNKLTLAEMRQQKSFTKFDFDSVWYIKDGLTYPLLRELPNIPVAVYDEMTFGETLQVKDVRESLLDHAFVMDTSYATVVKFEPASEKLLDSLENAEGKTAGEFVVSYRVGMLFGQDTIWSSLAQAKINLSGKTTDIRAHELAMKSGLRFGAVFQGGSIALRFEIPAAAAVKFSLVDMQGRVVRAFDLGHRAAGTHFETRSVENLPRGRYIGVLQVNGRATEKVILLKR